MVDDEAEIVIEETTEAEIETVLHEFNSNSREAIGSLLRDLKVHAEDSNRKVSKGTSGGSYGA